MPVLIDSSSTISDSSSMAYADATPENAATIALPIAAGIRAATADSRLRPVEPRAYPRWDPAGLWSIVNQQP